MDELLGEPRGLQDVQPAPGEQLVLCRPGLASQEHGILGGICPRAVFAGAAVGLGLGAFYTTLEFFWLLCSLCLI